MRHVCAFLFLFLLLFLLPLPSPLFAATYRGSDQIYLQAVGHVIGAGGLTYASDVQLVNLSGDPVTVSVRFAPANVSAPTIVERRDVLLLQPHEHRTVIDFLSSVVQTSGFGQVIFNACLQSADCSGYNATAAAAYRPISVSSRIYSYTTLAGPTSGQTFVGQPWYAAASASASSLGLNTVTVSGVRNNRHYRTNIGLANASEFSRTSLSLELRDSVTGRILSTATVTLAPLANLQQNVAVLFPAPRFYRGNQLQFDDAYITVTQRPEDVTVTDSSFCAATGCPAFFAYASLIDNNGNAATTLESEFETPNPYSDDFKGGDDGRGYDPGPLPASVTAPATVRRFHVRLEKE